MTGSSSSSRGKAIPRYVLYGEHEGLPGLEPLHVETIRARSDPNDWRIHPHRHAELHQFMRVSQGGGRMMAEGRETGFTAPCLLYVPPGAVHGFNWIPDSDGHVMMAADGLVANLPGGEAPPRRPFAAAWGGQEGRGLDAVLSQLLDLYNDPRPGRLCAMTGAAMLVIAAFMRAAPSDTPGTPDRGAARLTERLKALVEDRYREQPSAAEMCEALGVTQSRLNRACAEAGGAPPVAMVHERIMLEARRNLAYSSMGVAEIAYALGFSDPAYFSRFFKSRSGLSPAAWRRQAAAVPVSGRTD